MGHFAFRERVLSRLQKAKLSDMGTATTHGISDTGHMSIFSGFLFCLHFYFFIFLLFFLLIFLFTAWDSVQRASTIPPVPPRTDRQTDHFMIPPPARLAFYNGQVHT